MPSSLRAPRLRRALNDIEIGPAYYRRCHRCVSPCSTPRPGHCRRGIRGNPASPAGPSTYGLARLSPVDIEPTHASRPRFAATIRPLMNPKVQSIDQTRQSQIYAPLVDRLVRLALALALALALTLALKSARLCLATTLSRPTFLDLVSCVPSRLFCLDFDPRALSRLLRAAYLGLPSPFGTGRYWIASSAAGVWAARKKKRGRSPGRDIQQLSTGGTLTQSPSQKEARHTLSLPQY